jgi:uncharacterized membrane-anchored protein
MKFASRQHPSPPGLTGTARVDRRVGNVLRRSNPGDIVVIDHLDLDRGSAEALLEHRVAAVVNAAPFISGRFPNLGPQLLAEAGVVLVDEVGAEVFSAVRDGARLRIHGDTVYAGDAPVASGRRLELDDVQALMDDAREGLTTQLQSLTHNTTEFLRREQDLLLHGKGVPNLRTDLAGRPVVVVVREFEHEDDLLRMRSFIKEQHPVLVAVDAGADALVAAGLRPDLLVLGEGGLSHPGGVESRVVSDKALTRSREVLLHSDSSDRLVGADRLERLGIRPHRIAAAGATEDIALLVADIKGASVIITVGTHATLDEFLDRHRSGLASTFLTRLRVGPRLVDSRSVPALYAGRVRLWQLAVVLLAGVIALGAAVATTPVGEQWITDLWDLVARLFDTIQGFFS